VNEGIDGGVITRLGNSLIAILGAVLSATYLRS
jgi:hypothetical protein